MFQTIPRTRLTFRAVLDKRYSDEVDNVLVTVAAIRAAKDVSTVVRVLNTKLPIPRLQHLKRVKRVGPEFLVVLDYAPLEQPQKKRMKMDMDLLETLGSVRELLGDFKDVLVPAEGPRTRVQYQKCVELWPVNFHPEERVERLLKNEMFSSDEHTWHEDCMARVQKAASESEKNAALVADPVRRVVVALGVDERYNHPLKHAVMVVLDNVAGTQRDNGREENQQDPSLSQKSENADEKQPEEARETIEKAPQPVRDELPYLCTSWDVYLSREPCPMCAMGLVHSRSSRVFFAAREPQVGALVSCCQIQFVKDLNHHYQVFEVGT